MQVIQNSNWDIEWEKKHGGLLEGKRERFRQEDKM